MALLSKRKVYYKFTSFCYYVPTRIKKDKMVAERLEVNIELTKTLT